MSFLGNGIRWFLYITTGVLLVTAIFFSLMGIETIPVNTLWKILLSGFLTTIVTILFCSKEGKDGKNIVGSYIVHYMALCVVMSACGVWFGWIPFSWKGILFMAVAVACVYLICYGSYILVDKKQAEEINERLKEKYSEEE